MSSNLHILLCARCDSWGTRVFKTYLQAAYSKFNLPLGSLYANDTVQLLLIKICINEYYFWKIRVSHCFSMLQLWALVCVCLSAIFWCYCYDDSSREADTGRTSQKEEESDREARTESVCVCVNFWTLISNACARWRCALYYYIIKIVIHISMHTLAATVGHTLTLTQTEMSQNIVVKSLFAKSFTQERTQNIQQTRNEFTAADKIQHTHAYAHPHHLRCVSYSVCVCVY